MAYTTITVEIVQTIPPGGSFITTLYGKASWFQRGLATDKTTISGTRSLSRSPAQTASSTPTTTTHHPSFTTTTVTRSHPPAFTSTQTFYVDQWPQIGTIVSESDVPQQWRETYEVKALRQQYIAFGGICSIFVIGVLGVLALGWWKCWRSARSREEEVEQGGNWDWF